MALTKSIIFLLITIILLLMSKVEYDKQNLNNPFKESFHEKKY